jgi:hypothetical protein
VKTRFVLFSCFFLQGGEVDLRFFRHAGHPRRYTESGIDGGRVLMSTNEQESRLRRETTTSSTLLVASTTRTRRCASPRRPLPLLDAYSPVPAVDSSTSPLSTPLLSLTPLVKTAPKTRTSLPSRWLRSFEAVTRSCGRWWSETNPACTESK